MNNEDTTLDEELDTNLEDTADVEEDAAEDVEVTDDEFEYDEDGNIIIPEVVFDEDETLEDDEESVEEGETEEESEEEKSEETEEVTEPTNTKADDKDAKIAELEAKYAKLEAQSKDTLSKLGVNEEDVMKGLVSLAAEVDGDSPEEYLKKKAEKDRTLRAEALLRQQEFEKIATADIAELHATYPETKQYKHVLDLPNDIKMKFGRFRDAGLSAKEAYAAANPDGIRSNVATAVKKQSLHESKSHLRTSVPKGSKDDGITMSRSELSRWRDLFPNKSDKEIISLYKSTAK